MDRSGFRFAPTMQYLVALARQSCSASPLHRHFIAIPPRLSILPAKVKTGTQVATLDMSALRSHSTRPKTVTFIGTGPTGATTGGGTVKELVDVKEPVHVKPESTTTDDIKGKVLLQGNVVKSVVSHEVNNTGSLIFKGKVTTSKTIPDAVEIPNKRRADTGGVPADITVTQEAKMCVVSVSMTTNGICFEEDD